jgi:hypothetical protein
MQALALRMVPALRKGRRPALGVPAPPDRAPVRPPPRSWVRRVQRHLPPPLWAASAGLAALTTKVERTPQLAALLAAIRAEGGAA